MYKLKPTFILMLFVIIFLCVNCSREDVGSKYELIRVYAKFGDSFLTHPVTFVVKTPDGKYVSFDNEDDYSQYGELAVIFRESFYDYLKNKKVENVQDFLMGDIEEEEMQKTNPQKFESHLASVDKYSRAVVDGVAEYLYGNKSNIQDVPLLTAIDKAYYTCHPDNWVPNLDKSHYGSKYYSFRDPLNDNTYYMNALATKQGLITWYFSNNELVPDGLLMIQ